MRASPPFRRAAVCVTLGSSTSFAPQITEDGSGKSGPLEGLPNEGFLNGIRPRFVHLDFAG